ncbi:MAG: ATP-binding protein [Alphaproteobacteria bacterium]|nr:ATP-binding protein [Alphaproteobacteria bacterium]
MAVDQEGRAVRDRLLWKLLAINLPVIGVVILVVWVAVDFLAADYFTVLMERYKISPADTHQMFVDAVHRYLYYASLIAAVIAVLLSFLLTRTVLRPLSQMTEVTQRIAAGDYTARVDVKSKDELARLGLAFNRMADSLEQVEQLRRTMVVDLAHELRTPLTSLRGYLEAMDDGIVQPTKSTFHILQDEIMRLVRLVESLHQLTKADAAKAFLSRQDVDLSALINQVLELDRYQFQSRDIGVEAAPVADGLVVKGDRDKLLQVLHNLAQNAWQYTPAGGRLHVEAGRDGDGVRVVFANTGSGIAEDDLPLIFERFYRAEKSRSRDSGGAGIGLTIVKELVEAHGGTVGVDTDAGDIRFWFRLPA